MAVDIIDLTRFYETALGRHVAMRLQSEVKAIWPAAGPHDAVLAYGYARAVSQTSTLSSSSSFADACTRCSPSAKGSGSAPANKYLRSV